MKSTLLGITLFLIAAAPTFADLPRIRFEEISASEAEKLTANPDDILAALKIARSEWGTATYHKSSFPGGRYVTVTSAWTGRSNPQRTLTSSSTTCDSASSADALVQAEESSRRELTKGGVDWSSQVPVGQQRCVVYGNRKLEMLIRVGSRVLKLDLREVEVESPKQAEKLARRWIKRSLASE